MDFQRIKNFFSDNYLLIAIILLSFLLRMFLSQLVMIRGWDETVYLNLGKHLANNPFLYSLENIGWTDYMPSNEIIYSFPNVGFRAPLLPYIIAVFNNIGMSSLAIYFMPFIGALSVCFTYILANNLFNKRVALYSSIFIGFTPLHLLYSSQFLTEVLATLFIIISFLCFWKGFEQNNNKYKVLFGIFLAFALLSRYTSMWIFPVFLFYFLIRDRNFSFLKDKYLWISIISFFLILSPWFLYGLEYYGHILGSFIHGFKASAYWGGVQSYDFFIQKSFYIFSALSLFIPFVLFYIFKNKYFKNKEVYILLLWVFFFSFIVTMMPHKEERFIIPIIPPICILVGFFISNLKNYRKLVAFILLTIMAFSIYSLSKYELSKNNNSANICFMNALSFIRKNVDDNSTVVTNQSPIAYFYTGIKNIVYPYDLDDLTIVPSQYFLFSNYDMDLNSNIKKDLDNNFNKIFECKLDWGYGAIYTNT